jgi:eukaryotic-like serine/threonine-protein kinase
MPADATGPLSDPTRRAVAPALSSGGGPAEAPRVPAASISVPADAGELVGRLLDNRYRIEKKIGVGGMCVVYLAQDTHSGEQVAVKILLPGLMSDPISMARLRREAALAGKLVHRNVCHIIRLGEMADGFDYAVMPYVAGELLCDRVARSGHLPLPVTAAFVRDICAGLALAHALGVIHRDLKPENIMIATSPDGTERAVVIDFSLATAIDLKTLTSKGLVVGTPEFMSPEQLRGEKVDTRSDIYSLAFMVYEMIAGRLPFEGSTTHEIMIARLKGESIPIRARRPDLDIPRSLERVLARALSHDADLRYPTVEAFAGAFSRAARGYRKRENRVWRWIRAAVGE